MAVLFFDAGRLLGYLLLEIVVRILESGGHLVEACGDLADFVLTPHFGAGRQVARGKPSDGAAELLEGTDHPAEQKRHDREETADRKHNEETCR